MQYEKTVKDTYGDNVNVETESNSNVYLIVCDAAADTRAVASLTPEQARQIARALKRAANVAEGKPAKAKKQPPRVVVDAEGSSWHLSPNGLYWCGRGPDVRASWTHKEIAEHYGVREERA